MPARHTSPQIELLLKERISTGGSGRRKRVSARHQVKRLDRCFKRVRSFENRSGRRNRVFFVRCGSHDPQFYRRSQSPRVKSGPDVFADALVLQEPPPMVRAAPNFPNPPHSSFRQGRAARWLLCESRTRCSAEPGPISKQNSIWDVDPGSAAHHLSASKTRVNALIVPRSVRGTLSLSVRGTDRGNGYRFAKCHGKPNSAITRKPA